ncbi:MAG: hypothetical protein ACTHNU_07280 [Gaiellales bacterium]
MSSDRDLATALASELDGLDSGSPEASSLALALGEVAGAMQAVEVSGAEVEQALAATRPRLAGRRRPAWRLAAAAAVVVIAAVALLVARSTRGGPGVDVQAQAIAAVTRHAAIMVSEQISPGPDGGFRAFRRDGWYTPSGDARWTLRSGGVVVAQGLRWNGRLTVYDPRRHSAVVATSCRAIGSGCAQVADPVALYRRALLTAAPGGVAVGSAPGGYRLTLPVQRVPGGRRIDQVVRLDAATFLPTRITWVDDGLVVAVVRVTQVAAVPPDSVSPGTFSLSLPGATHVVQLAAPGQPVRLIGTRPIGVGGARTAGVPVYWLGPRFAGRPLTGVDLLRYTDGVAVRARYRGLDVWTYTTIVPPQLLANRLVPLKSLPEGSGTIQIYSARGGRAVVEFERRGATVGLVAPGLDFPAVTDAVAHLRRLR